MSKKEKYELPKEVEADSSLPVDPEAKLNLTAMDREAAAAGVMLCRAFKSVVGRQEKRLGNNSPDALDRLLGRKTKGETEAKKPLAEQTFEAPKVRKSKKRKFKFAKRK